MAEACNASSLPCSSKLVPVDDDTSALYASDTDSKLITGHTSSIKLWDVDKTTYICSLSNSFDIGYPLSDVTAICPINSDTIAVSLDRNVLFFDKGDLSKPKLTLENCCQDEINHLAVNKKAEFLSACDDSGEILIINISTGKKYKRCRKHDNICSVALFNPRKTWEIVSGGLDCCIINWDYSKGKPLSSLDMTTVSTPSPSGYNINPPMVHTLCSLGNDNPLIAAGLGNGCIALINPNKRGCIEVVAIVTTHSSSVNTICYINLSSGCGQDKTNLENDSSSQQLLISGGNDTKLIVSTLISAHPPHQAKPHIMGIERSKVIDHGSKINSCVYSETTGRVIVSDLTTNVSIYDPFNYL